MSRAARAVGPRFLSSCAARRGAGVSDILCRAGRPSTLAWHAPRDASGWLPARSSPLPALMTVHTAVQNMHMPMPLIGHHLAPPAPMPGPLAVPGLLEGGDARALLAAFSQAHHHHPAPPPQQSMVHLAPDSLALLLGGAHQPSQPAGLFAHGLLQMQMAQALQAAASSARHPASKEEDDLGPLVDVRGLQRREHGRRISAFNFFVKETVPQIRLQSPGLVHQECMKRVAEMWQGMSKEEKAKWCFDPPMPKGKKKRRASLMARASGRSEWQNGGASQPESAPKVQKMLPALPSLSHIISQGRVDPMNHRFAEGAGAADAAGTAGAATGGGVGRGQACACSMDRSAVPSAPVASQGVEAKERGPEQAASFLNVSRPHPSST